MNDYQRVQDRDELDNRIFDVLSQYLGSDTPYTLGNHLYINPDSLEVEVLIGIKDPGENTYPIQMFYRGSGHGGLEVNCDATYDVASKYVFIG